MTASRARPVVVGYGVLLILSTSACSGTSGNTARPATVECATGQSLVSGFPVDNQRGCVDTTTSVEVGCSTSATSNQERVAMCDRSSGQAYVSTAVPDQDNADFARCTLAVPVAALRNCELAACEDAINSICSLQDTCRILTCGNGGRYSKAGCRRRQCTSDAECLSSEECRPVQDAFATGCWFSLAGCVCGGTLDSRTITRCVPREEPSM
jgi:hypothetical protein